MTSSAGIVVSESERVEKFMSKAEKILSDVDNAYIITHRNHSVRILPTFIDTEIVLGNVLGTGGFGIVYEIDKFALEDKNNATSSNDYSNGSVTEKQEREDNEQQQRIQEDERQYMAKCTQEHHHQQEKEQEQQLTVQQSIQQHSTGTASTTTSTNPRYALKRLKKGLSALEYARGQVDLAIEAKFLSVVAHPNIIKIRGVARGNLLGDNFFIILDLLQCTLEEQMKQWAQLERKCTGGILMGLFGKKKKKQEIDLLLIERLTVAYDIASAFFYLHENRIVYRDIKPSNIGFDFRGDVKVFDFGLCKNLSYTLKARNFEYGYRLTGRVGSLPYMAPEVGLEKTYDTKCDVYSFAILLWEILSLSEAFKNIKAEYFIEKVMLDKERLPINKKWPPLTRLMIPEAWDNIPQKRPDMKRVAIVIRADLNSMTDDDDILQRTIHWTKRSRSNQIDLVPAGS